MNRLVTVDASQLAAMIAESVRAVLKQRGATLTAPGRTEEQLVSELSNNAGGAIAMSDVSDEAVAA